MSSKTAKNGITAALALKVNIAKLKTQFKVDNPYLNDLIFAGVSQFLGIKSGPIELSGSLMDSLPNAAMLQFLQDAEILIPEFQEEEKEKEVALHS